MNKITKQEALNQVEKMLASPEASKLIIYKGGTGCACGCQGYYTKIKNRDKFDAVLKDLFCLIDNAEAIFNDCNDHLVVANDTLNKEMIFSSKIKGDYLPETPYNDNF